MSSNTTAKHLYYLQTYLKFYAEDAEEAEIIASGLVDAIDREGFLELAGILIIDRPVTHEP